MRGFQVEELSNDRDELIHLQADRARRIPLPQLKSDLILVNGARLYNDHTHPEYSTPECLSLVDLVASDRAGEHILLECARRRTAERQHGRVRLFKNNTDFDGHGYGCHENYLLRRDVPFASVVAGLLPFLVTRQIFGGAGKVGTEPDSQPSATAQFQLTQRADFFETITSVDTMHRRPLVNTRDEPHADADMFRRLHVITGDANMAEFATALKVGSFVLVLDLLEAGALPTVQLADPVAAFRAISRDPEHIWAVPLANGRQSSALDIQHQLLEAARRHAAGWDQDTDWVLQNWQDALEQLAGCPHNLVGRVDWVTKKWLLDSFAAAEGLDWGEPRDAAWLQSQDLQYHSIDPADGLFMAVEEAGHALQLTRPEQRLQAAVQPPRDTRAWFRGRCLDRFPDAVRAVNWDRVELALDGRTVRVDLGRCLDPDTVAPYNRAVDQARSVAELVAALAAR